MPECIHFPDDPNAVCTMCKPKSNEDSWETVGDREFEAQYYGSCVECGGAIYKGDFIVSGGGGYKHENCRAHG